MQPAEIVTAQNVQERAISKTGPTEEGAQSLTMTKSKKGGDPPVLSLLEPWGRKSEISETK